jgi:hypothetical protein
MIVREMREGDCYAMIKSGTIARLACARDGQPYLVPIQYAYALNRLFSFSLPGRKIEIMRQNPKVCLEIEEFSDRQHWRCVLVEGVYHELASEQDRQQAWQALQGRIDWWEPGALKPGPQQLTDERSHLFYEIVVNGLTGRQSSPA